MTKRFVINLGRLSAALTVAVATTFASTAAMAERFTLLSGWPTNFSFYAEIGPRFEAIAQKQLGGNLKIMANGPDTVPSFEQLQPVQAGVFDMLFTHGAYHSGTTGIGLAIDAVANDPVLRRTSGLFEFMDQHYQTKGLKLLAIPSIGTKGFGYYLRDPIKAEPGLEGRRIRGTVTYHPMINQLGGAPVNLPPAEIYTGLQRGTVDGAAWALVGASDYKWYEVANYMAQPTFGQLSMLILMNLDRWKALPPNVQKALSEAGRLVEIESIAAFDQMQVKEVEVLQSKGMKFTKFLPNEAVKFDRMFADGVWQVAAGASKADSEKMREMARKANMTD